MIINALQFGSYGSWHERDSYHRIGPLGVSFKDSSPKTNTELITEKHLTGTHQKPILSSAQPPGTPGFDQDLNVSKACSGWVFVCTPRRWEGKAQLKGILQNKTVAWNFTHTMDWTEAFLAGQKCGLAGVPKPKNCRKHRPRGPLWVDTLCQGPKSTCGSWPGHIEAFSCLFRWCFKSCFACSSFYSFRVTKPIHLTIVLAKWNLSRNEGENTHVSSHDLFVCLLSPEQTVGWLLTCFLSYLGNCIGIFSIGHYQKTGKTNPHWRSGTQIWVPNDDTSIQNDMKLSESNYNFIHKKATLWDNLDIEILPCFA